MIRWLSRHWSSAADAFVRPPGAPCPHCTATAGRVMLLTAWTAYYTCQACHHRWLSARDPESHRMPPREVLLMLVSPTDHHGDARRLTQAGFRVISTSQAQSTARQVIAAAPAAVVVELVPGFGRDTFAFVAQLALASGRRRISLIVYGPQASGADRATIHRLGAMWIPLGGSNRGELGVAVCNAVLEGPL